MIRLLVLDVFVDSLTWRNIHSRKRNNTLQVLYDLFCSFNCRYREQDYDQIEYVPQNKKGAHVHTNKLLIDSNTI